MGEPMPQVSVIVPVRDRRDLLRACLDALAMQTGVDAEVIVVDDGSSDGSGEEAVADADVGRPVRLVDGGGRGAVEARRRGVEHARAPYLAFTDSDCVPDRQWLATGVAALDSGADLVNGRTVSARPAAPLERTTSSGEEGLYPTSNLFVRRDAYDRAGGFDSAAGARLGFRPGGRAQGLGFGEDTLLAWSVRRKGRVIYAPDAVVVHAVHPPALADALSRAWMAAAFPALVREVPELRDTLLVRRVGLGTLRRLPLYGAVLARLGGKRGIARAAALTWVLHHARDLAQAPGPPSSRVAALPVALALDAVTAAALVTGSVRARSLTL